MDTNEIMENEEVIETVESATEEVAKANTGKGLKVAAGAGLAVLGGFVIYKYVVKPFLAKRKAKRYADALYDEATNSDDAEDECEFDDSDFDSEED